MESYIGNSRDALRKRLTALPEALGFASDAAFAAHLGISPQRWNAAKITGNLSKAVAELLIQKVPGMTYEWIWSGKGPAHLRESATTKAERRSKPS